MPKYRTQSEDTSVEADLVLVDLWRRMPGGRKMQIVGSASMAMEEISLAGIRARYPDADDRTCRLHLAILRLGRQLVREAYGWEPEGGSC